MASRTRKNAYERQLEAVGVSALPDPIVATLATGKWPTAEEEAEAAAAIEQAKQQIRQVWQKNMADPPPVKKERKAVPPTPGKPKRPQEGTMRKIIDAEFREAIRRRDHG